VTERTLSAVACRQAGPRIVQASTATFAYRFELRRGEEVVSTGHPTREQELKVGRRLELGGEVGVVLAVEPLPPGGLVRSSGPIFVS